MSQTPGPLHADGRFVMAEGRCDTVDCPVRGIIAECVDTRKTDDDGRVFTVSGSPEGNALLFAAAPDLLAVAKKWDYYRAGILAKEFEPDSICLRELLDQTAAALAKAKP